MDEVWNVFYLDRNDCLYLIGNHAMEDCKHIIYDDDTTELMKVYLDENGNPNYKWDGEKLVKLISEEKETFFPKPQPSQLDEIEKGIEGIDFNTLTIMEGIASSYEAEQSNALILMEGIASLYEAQISEGAK